MNEVSSDLEEGATIEVLVFREGREIERVVCETEEQAALVVEHWSEVDGATCEVGDLGVSHLPEEILATDIEDILLEGDADGPDAHR